MDTRDAAAQGSWRGVSVTFTGKGIAMGKKPVFGLLGLIWAGVALTGCGQCCRNCNDNKFNSKPVFGSRTTAAGSTAPTTPNMIGDGRPTGSAPIQPARGPDTGVTGYSGGTVQPAVGMGSRMSEMTPPPPMPVEKQHNLSSPVSDRGGAGASGMAMPGRNDDLGGRTSISTTSRGGMTDRNSISVPPRPVTPTSSASSEGPALPSAPVPDSPPPSSAKPLPPIGSTPPPAPPGDSAPPPPVYLPK
jgi:hypothetical protein